MITIELPESKSIAARCTMMNAYGGFDPVESAGESDDVRVIRQAVESVRAGASVVNVADSGTALRFMLPYLASRPWGEFVLTGSQRLCQRPIAALVDALRLMDADIDYLYEPERPPLVVRGRVLSKGETTLRPNESSQFVSSLMLLGPTLPEGLVINLNGDMVSQTYVRLTAHCIDACNTCDLYLDQSYIKVDPGIYSRADLHERDWSAATFFYEAAAIRPDGPHFLLEGLHADDLQPDAVIHRVYAALGVMSVFSSEGVTLRPTDRPKPDMLGISARANPDIIPALVVTLCMKGIAFRVSEIEHLKTKESDRIAALIEECGRCGWELEEMDGMLIYRGGERAEVPEPVMIDPHGDHRIAMAFAVAGLCMPITILHPEVVNKSFPDFFKQLEKL